MRISLLFIVLLFSGHVLIYGQDEVVITLKNGTELNGYGKVSDLGVKYRAEKKGRYKNIKPLSIETVKVNEGSKKNQFMIAYTFRVLKKGDKPKLVTYTYAGDHISVFRHTITITKRDRNTGFLTESSVSKTYAMRKGERYATLLKNGDNGINLGKSFKKRAKDYFSDCSELVNKLGTKGFRKGDIYEIASYYDSNCGS